jgi:hypothetical protein
MLETMKWVQWLEVEQRHLVWMRAKRYGWRDITIRFACDRTTAWRRWQRALQTVADQAQQCVVGVVIWLPIWRAGQCVCICPCLPSAVFEARTCNKSPGRG